ncbi:SWIM zinc finger family protein [Halostagnicola kamekurae]|uniref:SWIM zinc finger family protein n=1 Tax=Halostagnicola kamekurae TaxID=619731 RepID=UPI001C31DC96|nr:SWIM zinc finger family protein [Halostagnicola kamekurae]
MAVAKTTGLEILDDRDGRALTTPMTVIEDTGIVRDADGMFEVTSASGREYIVDIDAPADARCSCDDQKHRRPDGGCKHIRRVLFAIGAKPIPSWVDPNAVDDQLGAFVSSGNPVWSE